MPALRALKIESVFIRAHSWLNTLFAIQRACHKKGTATHWGEHPIARSHCRPYSSDMSTVLIIVLLLVLFGGGGGYYYTRRR